MKQPNIIFILTDDQRYNAFGFMGNEQVYTPNLDKLASESAVFSQAYHVTPICMPSRVSIQLGKYLCEHKCGFDLPTDYTVTKEEYQESYPVMLRKNGYFTGFIGKFGFPVYTEKVHRSKNKNIHPLSDPANPFYKTESKIDDLEESLPSEEFDVWKGFKNQGNYTPDKKTNTFNGYENKWQDDHLTMFNAHLAEEFLIQAKDSGKPFSLSISFKAPHRPMIASKKWQDFYKDTTIKRMPNDNQESFNKLPEVVRTISRNMAEYFGSPRLLATMPSWKPIQDEATFQSDFQNYYGLISGVDEAVGYIRDCLKELELDKDTIIIYTSDNGYFCGSRQLGGKALLYEESIKAPLIVYNPNDEKGQCIESLVSIVDICPTILDLAGIEKTAQMNGESVMSLINGSKTKIHDAVFGENDFNDNYVEIDNHPNKENYQSIHSKYVRTKDFKYVRFQLCKPVIEELWDMKDDPGETNNLVADPAYKEQLNYMRKLLDDFIREHTV